ncbi:MAG: radical SAM protein [Gammaproteobacteria bacterium]|nr:radical SAM protein [Gammaproteobacteria bacterium]
MLLCYEEPLYRPPSEANNLILQVTIGCRFNQCSFCSMYKHKEYRLKSIEDIQLEIDRVKQFNADVSRIFLADGDAFNLDSAQLLEILKRLQAAFPKLTRVSCYATPANISAKSADELALLKANKLSLIYVGIETGSNLLLKKITKGATQNSIARSLKLADAAGIKVSATIILGLGGHQFWQQHITETVALLNAAPVSYLSTLQLYLDKSAEAEFIDKFAEEFQPQSDADILQELAQLISQLRPVKKIIFRSNHASNALALAGNLPKDRDKLLAQISRVMNLPDRLRPQSSRSL